MMKGYLTIFLSLSLSLLTGFLLLLNANAVRNAWKIRLEGAADLGMNSVLGEYNIELHDRYGLFYIDISYGGKEPSLSNMEERLAFYISQNLQKKDTSGPFGKTTLVRVEIEEAASAAAGNGRSMKSQAVQYVNDCGITYDVTNSLSCLGELKSLEMLNAEEEWRRLMEQIEGMELPQVLNAEGVWEEVLLSNPADGIFSLLGSDILYLTGVDIGRASVAQIRKGDYISERISGKTLALEDVATNEANTDLFLVYLSEKMGNYGKERQDSLLKFQLEYIAKGKASDYENLKAVVQQLLKWRFAVNAAYALSDSGLYQEASGIAQMLTAVQLNASFGEPVTKSILYACAYLESIGDVRCLLAGGRVELYKSHFDTGIEQVLSGQIPSVTGSEGLNYEQYLLCMLYMLPEDTRNLRAMDIMEMDVRSLSGNPYFAMDFCIERYTAQIQAVGSLGDHYYLTRTYGYY